MATILVGSYMVRYPLGGNLSWVLQYLTGFKDLGHDVYLLEKYVDEDACFDPVEQHMTNDCSFGLKTVSKLLAQFDLNDKWCFVEYGNTYHGLSKDRVEQLFDRADLYIENGAHGAWNEELNRSKALKVYIDVDPVFTQVRWFHRAKAGIPIPEYDHYYTNGMNIGKEDNVIPACGIQWKYIFNPVNTRLFSQSLPHPGSAYSTIMNWKSYPDDVLYKGITYGHKDVEFEKFAGLPGKVNVPMELALAGAPEGKDTELAKKGWRICHAQSVTFTYDLFMSYLRSCRGEFSVVKNMYAASCSGWFSDKSAAFLASGRPVILQETGFSKYLPTGEGLFAVRDVTEAKDAIATIEKNYTEHSKRAFDLAREYLDTRVVLVRFLSELHIPSLA